MVPGASDSIADDQTLGERSVVMRAVRTDRKDLRLTLDDQHLLIADVSLQDAVAELMRRNASGQISRAVCGSHGNLVNW